MKRRSKMETIYKTGWERIFILDSEDGFKLAEEFKASLENQGLKVETKPWGFNGVRIKGAV